jgi:hypothetical protein
MSTLDTLQALPRLFRYVDLYKFTGNAMAHSFPLRVRTAVDRFCNDPAGKSVAVAAGRFDKNR